ncbi:hypothetical protein M758_9G015800 [Ceratodon purpureus]|nr:hypothetical protein M758_9G015800 [Ceratodon purpureus]
MTSRRQGHACKHAKTSRETHQSSTTPLTPQKINPNHDAHHVKPEDNTPCTCHSTWQLRSRLPHSTTQKNHSTRERTQKNERITASVAHLERAPKQAPLPKRSPQSQTP